MILCCGAAGKSALARQLGDLTGLPVIELDTPFWQPGLTPAEPAGWAARQDELCSRGTWIIDGDLGPCDQDLGMRLSAAGTIIVLDLAFPRVAWRTLRRGRERPGYWRWVWADRRRYLPQIRTVITANPPAPDCLSCAAPARSAASSARCASKPRPAASPGDLGQRPAASNVALRCEPPALDDPYPPYLCRFRGGRHLPARFIRQYLCASGLQAVGPVRVSGGCQAGMPGAGGVASAA